MKKVGFITLGCKVNIYESNALEQELVRRGYSIIEPSSVCDVFVINTCTVTNTADQKSRQMVSKARRLNPNACICLMGCYVQTKRDVRVDADIILGNGNKLELPNLLEEYFKTHEKHYEVIDIMRKRDFEKFEVTTYDHSRAFVKIQDGCNQFCAYCIIPYARGPIRSKNSDSVIEELVNITNDGYEEVVLSGIHTGKYNDNGTKLSDLIERILNEVPKLKRLRLSSIEINEIDDKLIELMRTNPVLANHLHLPLQCGCDKILSLMNRPYNTSEFLAKVEKIRSVRPDIAITTDVIVGFPYETNEDFDDTVEFIKKVGFTGLHVFPYSRRENTKAADMPQVNGLIKKARAKVLGELSLKLQHKYELNYIGHTLDIIVEQLDSDGYLCGHSSNYIKVHFKGDSNLIKSNQKVKVTNIVDDIVYGELV